MSAGGIGTFARATVKRSVSVAARSLGAGRSAAERALAPSRERLDRLIVLDPGLLGAGGHHFEFAHLLRSEFSDTRKVTCYAHRWASPLVAVALNARLIFRSPPTSYATGASFADIYAATTRSLASALNDIDERDLQPSTIAVMHTTTIHRLGALAAWYASLEARRRPRLFVQFQTPLECVVAPRSEWPAAVRLGKAAAAALTSAGTVRFAANSVPLANRIADELERPCAVMPVPVRWPEGDALGPPRSAAAFGFFGGLRAEKGAAILAPAIARFSHGHPDARFIIQAPRAESDAAAVAELARIPQVELIHKSFGRKSAYFRCMLRARWILLPYDPEPYAIRTSGIFLEALGLGIPVIVPAGTWMAAELRSRGARGIVMPAYDAPALCDTLVAAREAMLAAPDERRTADRALIAEQSPAAFCAAILRLMDS